MKRHGKFGRLPARRSDRTLKLANYMNTDVLPQPAPSYNSLSRVCAALGATPDALFPMDGNDNVGDCTIAALAHADTVFNGLAGRTAVMPTSDCLSLYYHLTGGQDTGLDVLTVMDYWKANPVNGDQILGYVSVDVSNRYEVKQAISMFGGVYIGFQVQENCVQDFDWNKPWRTAPLSQDGHAVFVTGYEGWGVSALTWGGEQWGTWGWWNECVDEVYVILPPEAQLPGFAPGFDFVQLQADLAAL